MKQVDKEHYSFESYGYVERFSSYHYQLREVFDAKPSSVLEVGVGDKVVANYVKDNSSIAYKSIDIAEDLHPDTLGSVLDLPFQDNSFDVVCAFEVLEHLPFKDFERAVCEMSRVAKKRVLISVPHFGPPIKLLLKVPFIKEIKFLYKIPFFQQHIFNGQHYWEIGKKGFSLSVIKSVLNKHVEIIREYVPFENPYHHFFILEKKQKLV